MIECRCLKIVKSQNQGGKTMIKITRLWKIYLTFTLVLLVSMTVAGFILEIQLKKQLKQYLADEAMVLGKLVADILPPTEDSLVLDPFCKKYGEIAGVRISIIKTEGKVIGESDRKSIRTDSHLKRPEIQDAVKNGMGTAIRFSDTLNIDMLYVASLLKEQHKIVRIAIPMKKIKEIENEVMILLALALYLTPFLAIVVSFFFAKSVSD
ncbi:MAG: hypothetical protein BWK80_40135 [Desulfobacteraceae bacterium IS3]|nr:MAG: hypothetical protein BWK80_40135 [Desulfobacteraceae bacterium IS3]